MSQAELDQLNHLLEKARDGVAEPTDTATQTTA